MAAVDFSHAKIYSCGGAAGAAYKISYLCLQGNLTRVGTNIAITSSSSMTIVNEDQSGFTVLYTGVFTESGTSFQIYDEKRWKVTGVNFSAGDTYSFQVRVDLPTESSS